MVPEEAPQALDQPAVSVVFVETGRRLRRRVRILCFVAVELTQAVPISPAGLFPGMIPHVRRTALPTDLIKDRRQNPPSAAVAVNQYCIVKISDYFRSV